MANKYTGSDESRRDIGNDKKARKAKGRYGS